MEKTLSYAQSINEALFQAMDFDKSVAILGQLVDYSPGIFGTTIGLAEKFGKDKVIDFPVSESLMTSKSIGMAVGGMRPVLVHQRLDFSMYSMDAIINWMSLWKFKSGGESNLPITIRAIIGKGWGQGPQHSKSLYSLFAHLPGIRVCVPSNPRDAKGLLLDCIFGEAPSIFLENRALFDMEGLVPEDMYVIPHGKANVIKDGSDLTIVSFGNELQITRRAIQNISCNVELIDLRSIKPLDIDTIIRSVNKTGKLMVVEGDWRSFGAASEIISSVCESNKCHLEKPPVRLCYPNSHTPASQYLEKKFYINENDIVKAIQNIV
jgi:acetoin:2,6-dichlorophenolindophenol oxidoreductase subunit beta